MSLNKAKAIIWDMDGVIVDSGPYHCRAWQYVFHKRGVEFTERNFQRHFGQRNDTIMRSAMGDDVSADVMADIAEEKTFTLGEMIFEEGEKAKWVYVLLEGKVRISIDLTSKPTYVTVAIIDECNWAFGWSGIVAPYRYTATATCEMETRVLAIPGVKFDEILDQETDCSCKVMRNLAVLISSRLRNSRMVLLRTM